MNLVDVPYTVPVTVTVDLDTGRVTRVVVCDEDATLARHELLDTPEGEAVSDDEAEQAVAIAENEPWPAWEVG